MTLYRYSAFMFKGLREFSVSGYEKALRTFDSKDLDVDVTGKSYVITGANSGIGKATASAIAKKGGTIHMVCRDTTRGNLAKDELIEETGNNNIYLHILDMSKPADVFIFCTEFVKENQCIDVLVNNAGCMENDRIIDEHGLEKNFATNVLGSYIMTVQMLPLLEKSEKPRVIMVSSGGMLLERLKMDDLNSEKLIPFNGASVYSQNKRQQVIMAEKLAEEHQSIHFSSMHPGWASTPAVKKSIPKFYETWKSYFKTPEQGADTIIWLSISNSALSQPSGGFYQDRKAVSKHLPLAWTKETDEERTQLIKILNDLMHKFSE